MAGFLDDFREHHRKEMELQPGFFLHYYSEQAVESLLDYARSSAFMAKPMEKVFKERVMESLEHGASEGPFKNREVPGGKIISLSGRYDADELEAMAWCMRNDKWPERE